MEKNPDILIFTLDGCEPCNHLKMYLDQKGYKYRHVKIFEEISIETFEKIYPNSVGFPHAVVNGHEVFDLILYLESEME